jgi:hypothetical protein
VLGMSVDDRAIGARTKEEEQRWSEHFVEFSSLPPR